MTGRERILAALQCDRPDRVPVFEMYMNGSSIVAVHRLLTGEQDDAQKRQDLTGQEGEEVISMYCEMIEALDVDATCFGVAQGLQPEGEGLARDKFGVLFELSDLGEPYPIEGPIRSKDDIPGYDMAADLADEDFAQVVQIMETLGPARAHLVSIPDPYKVAWRLRGGMQELLVDFATDSELVHGVMRIATDYCLAAVRKTAETGTDGIAVPGDLAGEHTLLMSPTHYREMIKPYEAEIVKEAHCCGLPIFKHSDGNMWQILDDLLEIGFDGFHPVQPQCMNIGEVKEHLAGRMCVLGNIDCRELLVNGSPVEVEATVRETIEIAAPGGGYILTSSNSIHPSVKPENYIAMVQAAHKYGSYM
ncbi:MAG: uroporphyrinogen decarboxylase family protein [Armatimonadota bacterium]